MTEEKKSEKSPFMMSNQEFTNFSEFKKACNIANVAPTQRQASRFRNRRGSAFKAMVRANRGSIPKTARRRGY